MGAAHDPIADRRAEQTARIARCGARLWAQHQARRAAWRIARGHATRHPRTSTREIARDLIVRACGRTAVGCVFAGAVLLPPPSALEPVHWALLCLWTSLVP